MAVFSARPPPETGTQKWTLTLSLYISTPAEVDAHTASYTAVVRRGTGRQHLSTLTQWLRLGINCSFNSQNGRRTIHKGPLSLQTSHYRGLSSPRAIFSSPHSKSGLLLKKRSQCQWSQWSLQKKGSVLRQTGLEKNSHREPSEHREAPADFLPLTRTNNCFLGT